MKKMMIVAAVAFSAVLANADYLYWQTNAADANGGQYAALYENGSMVQGWMDLQSADAVTTYTYDNASSGSSYYIEYANYNDGFNHTGASESQTYTQLAQNHAIITGTQLPTTMAQVWQGGSNYAAAPEPTSALLMLFGLAGLALKRRHA